MFSAVIEEALTVERQNRQLLDQARQAAAGQEKETLNQINTMLKEATEQGRQLIAQQEQQANNQEQLLTNQLNNKITQFRTSLVSSYSKAIEEAAEQGAAIILTSSIKEELLK